MDELGPYNDAINPDTQWDIATAIVRLTPGTFHTYDPDPNYYTNTGAYLHFNSAHIEVGATQVLFHKTDHCMRIVVPGAGVGYVDVSGDEVSAKYGLLWGCSGGNDGVNAYAYRTDGSKVKLANAAEYSAIAESGNNVWCIWVWPRVRGTGGPSLQDQIDALTARVEALENP